MASLDRNLRRDLENAVKKARRVAEAGARDAINQLAVGHYEPWPTLSPEQRKLRNRLRAHGRQLGDRLDERKGTQSIERLTSECAYEHWHRLLFARFLAENHLLVEPESSMALSLDECRELAREQGRDWLVLASDFAQRMLPQIFRAADPVLEVFFPPERRQELENLLLSLPGEIFAATDSLGWCYQFWQSDQKEEINATGEKIGADELPAVTQLFTEDYMVDFLLDNTLGAWYAAKAFAADPHLAISECGEDELRRAVTLPGCEWRYLRLDRNPKGKWVPAFGAFERWPRTAKEIKCLDPCMGSGHFVVALFERVVALRVSEEGLEVGAAIDAVLRDNIFGLEIDPRCAQIAAFNLAMAAWRRVGHRPLPPMNLACSGLAPNAREAHWLELAGRDATLRGGMEYLYRLFRDAPVLGSLIDPRASTDDLLTAGPHALRPLLERALAEENSDESIHEMAATAQGVASAGEILASKFTLVATNVPYLGRPKQVQTLLEYCERVHPEAKSDLATCFIERCLEFCLDGGSTALVAPQNWLFLGSYRKLREKLLRGVTWNSVAKLGPKAFQTPMWDFNVCLISMTRQQPAQGWRLVGLDVSSVATPLQKGADLVAQKLMHVSQEGQLKNPDSRLVLSEHSSAASLLNGCTECYQGLRTGDRNRFVLSFWEIRDFGRTWEAFRNTSSSENPVDGISEVVRWEEGHGSLHRYATETRDSGGPGS